MSATAKEPAIRVVVSADKMTAELWLPTGAARQVLTPDLCETMLREAGVDLTAPVRAAVSQALASPAPPGQSTLRAAVAWGIPAKHGVDGRVEWLVEAPARINRAAAAEAPTVQRNYYDASAFVIVKPGMAIGRVHPPTDGEDGRDVVGRAIPAKAGKACSLKLDETILLDGGGTLIAQAEGVLIREENKATIHQVLDVPGYVDFSTGNIDFHGDVKIGKGVRDLFTVKATGNVEVAGLIEAATILAGQDLIARGGFAGRERGIARCGGSVQAKYLDNVQGEVLRDITIDREIINCEMTVHGNLQAVHGAIIGGKMTVTGKVHVGMLGSAGAVPTELVIGSVPRLEPLCSRLREFVEKLTKRHEQLLADQAQLNNLVGKKRATAADKERQTEFIFEISNAQTLLAKAQPTLAKLEERITQQRTVDLTIERKLFPGVVLAVGRDRYQISSEVKGPLRIHRDGRGDLVYGRGDQPGGLLLQIADLRLAA